MLWQTLKTCPRYVKICKRTDAGMAELADARDFNLSSAFCRLRLSQRVPGGKPSVQKSAKTAKALRERRARS